MSLHPRRIEIIVYPSLEQYVSQRVQQSMGFGRYGPIQNVQNDRPVSICACLAAKYDVCKGLVAIRNAREDFQCIVDPFGLFHRGAVAGGCLFDVKNRCYDK